CLAFAHGQQNVGTQFDFTFGAEERAFNVGDVKEERRQLAFLDAFVDGGSLDGHEHGDAGRGDAHVSFVMQAEVFNPLAAFRVRPLPTIGARAGRWLADNLPQIFRHFDEWKLYESHISYIVSY